MGRNDPVFRSTSDHVIKTAIKATTGFSVPFHCEMKEFLTRWQENTSPWPLPHPAKDLRIVLDKAPVIGAFLNPQHAKVVLRITEETYETPMLIMDGVVPGREGLYLLQQFSADKTVANYAQEWLSRMISPRLLVQTMPNGDTLMATQLKSFYE